MNLLNVSIGIIILLCSVIWIVQVKSYLNGKGADLTKFVKFGEYLSVKRPTKIQRQWLLQSIVIQFICMMIAIVGLLII